MDDAILYFFYGIGSFGSTIFDKINRTFCKIGYSRAASELSRAGYFEEAEKCIRHLKELQ